MKFGNPWSRMVLGPIWHEHARALTIILHRIMGAKPSKHNNNTAHILSGYLRSSLDHFLH
jgi:hypothetical protein